jgi:phosphate transport system permease protein
MPGFEGRLIRREAVAEGFGMVAFVVITVMIVGLVVLIAANAAVWFWPAPIWEVETSDGRILLGQVVRGVSDTVADGAPHRWRLRTEDGRLVWLEEGEVAGRERPDAAAQVMFRAGGRRMGSVDILMAPDGTIEPHPEPATVLRAVRTADRLADRCTELERELGTLRRQLRAPASAHEVVILSQRIRDIETSLEKLRGGPHLGVLRVRQPGGTADVPLEDVSTVVWPNQMGWAAKAWHAAAELRRFLVTNPRSANTEGGVYPALFGTVTLVFLMTLAVMPLGVLCAVYMTEYARDGLLLRIATHAVNNLAGVPSIVFGMFGLAFFIYGVGGTVDRTLFGDRLPTPTFGTGGILWAALTLALLTVPVVVVATREGLENVPPEWRTASRALGATQWQTLRNVVLPAAVPGMLTGLILAVSRAAGEVAPLMLTGVVKLAHSLPVDGTAPYLHLDRKFMHLGYHIWDVSMQSPNVEAAKPMAFASALVLLGFVVLVNLVAIWARSAARRRYHQGEA